MIVGWPLLACVLCRGLRGPANRLFSPLFHFLVVFHCISPGCIPLLSPFAAPSFYLLGSSSRFDFSGNNPQKGL
ncbi:hypothetical protein ThrDRAFT_02523 [Frankia casuarinae]|nr:hypothetical protein CcI6DRAFT_02531 [Frankia sp. CcI6]EYT91878.1 hypothetical protein ThrDRAFT_02523 [Frankia casuarinae]KFB04213.1 hypothetical protein ALLO2DRAFT_02984 [Frankia sp. Allo2]